jgi:hypothetical protein
MQWTETKLWERTLGSTRGSIAEQRRKERLRTAYQVFRERAAHLAALIPRDVPGLTDHSVHHLDALWEIASMLSETIEPFNPLEAFVFGGAILLHDLLTLLRPSLMDWRGFTVQSGTIWCFLPIEGRSGVPPTQTRYPCQTAKSCLKFCSLDSVTCTPFRRRG